MTTAKQIIAITGTGGQLGQLVAEGLLRTVPANELRFASRNPGRLRDFAERGVECVEANFDDPKGSQMAFRDVQTLLLISADGPNEVRIPQHLAAIDAAKAAGVGRIVYTSFANPVAGSQFPFAKSHAATEEHLKSSGLRYTILRNGPYLENLDNFLFAARQSGILVQPDPGGKITYISRRDIAMAIVAALTRDGHDDKVYEITGAEALDLFEIAQTATAKWGRPVTAKDISPDEFAAQLRAHNLPPFMVEAVVGLFAAAAAGEYSRVSPDVEFLTGWEPMTLASYLAFT